MTETQLSSIIKRDPAKPVKPDLEDDKNNGAKVPMSLKLDFTGGFTKLTMVGGNLPKTVNGTFFADSLPSGDISFSEDQ